MDTLAHALWTIIGCKAIEKKKKLHIGYTTLWSIFPDIFSFTLLFIWIALSFLAGKDIAFLLFKDNYIHTITHFLYSLSHSIVVFLFVFLIVWGVRYYVGKPDAPIVMFGWLFHIVLDIFTHSYTFYPTKFLWPITTFTINGVAWHMPWFMAINYSAIVIAILIMKKKGMIRFGKRNPYLKS